MHFVGHGDFTDVVISGSASAQWVKKVIINSALSTTLVHFSVAPYDDF